MTEIEKLNTVKQIVAEILSNDLRAREDDLYLVWKVYSTMTKIYIPFEDFKMLPRPESISRARRMIQNKEGRFRPSIAVKEIRHNHENVIKQWVA